MGCQSSWSLVLTRAPVAGRQACDLRGRRNAVAVSRPGTRAGGVGDGQRGESTAFSAWSKAVSTSGAMSQARASWKPNV